MSQSPHFGEICIAVAVGSDKASAKQRERNIEWDIECDANLVCPPTCFDP